MVLKHSKIHCEQAKTLWKPVYEALFLRPSMHLACGKKRLAEADFGRKTGRLCPTFSEKRFMEGPSGFGGRMPRGEGLAKKKKKRKKKKRKKKKEKKKKEKRKKERID